MRAGEASSLALPWCAETRPTELRGLAVIEPEQTAEALTTFDRACSNHRGRGHDEFVAEPLVGAFFMIMPYERSNGRSAMRSGSMARACPQGWPN